MAASAGEVSEPQLFALPFLSANIPSSVQKIVEGECSPSIACRC